MDLFCSMDYSAVVDTIKQNDLLKQRDSNLVSSVVALLLNNKSFSIIELTQRSKYLSETRERDLRVRFKVVRSLAHDYRDLFMESCFEGMHEAVDLKRM